MFFPEIYNNVNTYVGLSSDRFLIKLATNKMELEELGEQVECLICGEPINLLRSDDPPICSRPECYFAFNDLYSDHLVRGFNRLRCSFCGKYYYKRTGNKNSKFCSVDCMIKGNVLSYNTKKIWPANNSGNFCRWCGKELNDEVSRIFEKSYNGTRKRRFCCTRCRRNHEKFTGYLEKGIKSEPDGSINLF